MRVLVALFLIASPVIAQPIATDRPDFTESTEAVPLRSVQVEAGSTVESGAGAESLSGPELLLRFGILDRLELRLEGPDYVDGGAGARGLGDAAAGVKLQLGPVNDWGLALIGMLTLPIGDSTIGSGRVDPSLIATASRDLTDRLSMGAQLGAARAAEGPADLEATLVVGTNLSDRVGTFVEVVALGIADDAGLLAHHGYTFAAGESAQFDAHAAVGIAGSAPAWLVGVGAAIRF